MAAELTVSGEVLPGRVKPILKLKLLASSIDGRRFGCMVLGGWCSKWSSTDVILVDAIIIMSCNSGR